MIDLTETFEQICQLKGWIYDYGRHDFHNLEEADDENDPKCFFFLDPLERDDSRDDRTIFSSNFMFVQNSNIDEVYHTQRDVSAVDGKFEKRIKPKLTILNDELKKQIYEKEKAEIFFTYWTLKESFLKAIGTGLTKKLSSFTINETSIGSFTLAGDPEAEGFYLHNFSFAEGYKLSACSSDPEFCQEVKILPAKALITP